MSPACFRFCVNWGFKMPKLNTNWFRFQPRDHFVIPNPLCFFQSHALDSKTLEVDSDPNHCVMPITALHVAQYAG